MSVLHDTLIDALEKLLPAVPKLETADSFSPLNFCGCSGNCGQSCSGGCEAGCTGNCGRSCSGAGS